MTAPSPAGRRARVTQGATAAAGLACVVGLVAACGSSSSSSAASSSTVTVTATPTASSPAPAASPSSAPSASSAPSVPPCPTRSLQVKLGPTGGAAGSDYASLDFVNISNVTCTLYGYPGVSLAGGQPVAQIGAAAVEDHSSARELVTLAPQAAASSLLRIVAAGNFSPSACQPVTAHYLQVFPPNQTTPTYVGYTAQACVKPVKLLTIRSMRPGAGRSS